MMDYVLIKMGRTVPLGNYLHGVRNEYFSKERGEHHLPLEGWSVSLTFGFENAKVSSTYVVTHFTGIFWK